MWNSNSWGWPPNLGFEYNQHQDPSQNWAAAAALWAQQRQVQQQYQEQQQNAPKPPTDQPPSAPPPPPSDEQVHVHDYNHGKTNSAQVIDYQYENVLPHHTNSSSVIDYHHGKNEQQSYTDNNWPQHNNWQHQIMGYLQQNHQQWDGTYNNQKYSDNVVGEEQEGSKDDSIQPRNFHSHEKPPNQFDGDEFERRNNNSNEGSDITEANKRKGLPLWLKEGLEKLEKDKKKQHKQEDEIPDDKNISRYEHVAPPHYPGEREESDEELTDHKSSPVMNLRRESTSASDEEKNEEERQRQLMLKIKTWMTETLLGVTNSELRKLCEEIYFEMKRSGEEVTSSEEEDESSTDILSSFNTRNVNTYRTENKHEEETEEKSLAKKHVKQSKENRQTKQSKQTDSNSDDSRENIDHKHDNKKERKKSKSFRRSRKKSRYDDEEENSSDEEKDKRYKKKKKKRKYSSADDEEYSSDYSSSRRKKSKAKKHKQRDRSVSRSPKRSKRKK